LKQHPATKNSNWLRFAKVSRAKPYGPQGTLSRKGVMLVIQPEPKLGSFRKKTRLQPLMDGLNQQPVTSNQQTTSVQIGFVSQKDKTSTANGWIEPATSNQQPTTSVQIGFVSQKDKTSTADGWIEPATSNQQPTTSVQIGFVSQEDKTSTADGWIEPATSNQQPTTSVQIGFVSQKRHINGTRRIGQYPIPSIPNTQPSRTPAHLNT